MSCCATRPRCSSFVSPARDPTPRTLDGVETPEPPVPDEDADRDLGALEQAEHDLADLERELNRIEGTEEIPEG